MPTTAERDMEKLIHVNIQKLYDDIGWRCEALDIDRDVWIAMLVRIMMAYAISTACVLMPTGKKQRAEAEAQFRNIMMRWIDNEIREFREIEQEQ